MNTFSTPEARFWQERLRPGERLLWAGRPRATLLLDRAVVWAVAPAVAYASFYLFSEIRTGTGVTVEEMLADWRAHTIPLTMLAALIYCAVYLYRFGVLLPSQQVYAITDRRLMVWRRSRSPRLVEEEIGVGLRLERPRRPPNSVMFDYEHLFRPQSGIPGRGRDTAGRRKVGFINPRNAEGMERALTAALKGDPERARHG